MELGAQKKKKKKQNLAGLPESPPGGRPKALPLQQRSDKGNVSGLGQGSLGSVNLSPGDQVDVDVMDSPPP